MASYEIFKTNCRFYYLLCFQFGESKGCIFTSTYKVIHETTLSSVFLRGVGVSCVISVPLSSLRLVQLPTLVHIAEQSEPSEKPN